MLGGGGWGGVGCVNQTTRSGYVPEQVQTGHRPKTGTVPVLFSRCERYMNEWNGTGTLPEREPEQVGNSTVTELQFTTFFDIHVCIGNSSLHPERRFE